MMLDLTVQVLLSFVLLTQVRGERLALGDIDGVLSVELLDERDDERLEVAREVVARRDARRQSRLVRERFEFGAIAELARAVGERLHAPVLVAVEYFAAEAQVHLERAKLDNFGLVRAKERRKMHHRAEHVAIALHDLSSNNGVSTQTYTKRARFERIAREGSTRKS